MDVGRTYAVAPQVVVELLGHTLGKSGDEDALAAVLSEGNLLHKVVNLMVRGLDGNQRVEQTGRTYHLLDHYAFAFGELEVGRCCRHVDGLIRKLLKLFEAQGAIVKGAIQTEAIVHKILLAREITAIHGAYLRYGYMTFIDNRKIILREVVEQTEWTHTCLAAVEIAAVVSMPGQWPISRIISMS